jgi:hypothetical protein
MTPHILWRVKDAFRRRLWDLHASATTLLLLEADLEATRSRNSALRTQAAQLREDIPSEEASAIEKAVTDEIAAGIAKTGVSE